MSPGLRKEIRLLSFWAAHKAIIHEETAEALLQAMVQSFLEKYPEALEFVKEMK